MTRPADRAQFVETPFALVETSPGSGSFVRDDRIRVTEVHSVIGERMSDARADVRLDDAFDLVAARERYNSDLRFVVVVGDSATGERRVLFDGYPVVQRSLRRGGPRGALDRYEINAVGVLSRWSQDVRSWVFGRRMRNGLIEDGLQSSPDAFADQSVLVSALPCVFNLDDAPNRSAEPVEVVAAAGRAHRIFLFTYDGDPAARRWSLADALRYLVWFHHTSNGPIGIDAFMDATAAAVDVDPLDRGPFIPVSAAIDRLLTDASDLNCEATNLVEAINLVADAAGLSAGVESTAEDGAVRCSFRMFAANDGRLHSLNLAWGGRYADGSPRYDTSRLTAGDVTRDNQLVDVDIRWRHDNVVTAPMVVGGVKRFEITVPLVPGWVPEIDLDNVALVDRDDAKALAVTPDIEEFLGDLVEDIPWYQKYHWRGSDFDAHRDVGRLWVLNEDGAFDGATYNRNAPFDDYQPFDFSTVADESVTMRGGWARRLRPMLAALTRDGDGNALGVVVQVSYDSGLTWHPPVGAVAVDKVRAAIRFNISNPTAMVEPDGDFLVTNLWFALIDQTFRVRATAVFESDDRLHVAHSPNPAAAATSRRNGALIYDPRRYELASREGTANALLAAHPDRQIDEADDTRSAEIAVRRLAGDQQSGAVEVTARIPWMDDAIALGDRIDGIAGRDVSLRGLPLGASASDTIWHVFGKQYQIGERDIATTLELARAPMPVDR